MYIICLSAVCFELCPETLLRVGTYLEAASASRYPDLSSSSESVLESFVTRELCKYAHGSLSPVLRRNHAVVMDFSQVRFLPLCKRMEARLLLSLLFGVI